MNLAKFLTLVLSKGEVYKGNSGINILYPFLEKYSIPKLDQLLEFEKLKFEF